MLRNSLPGLVLSALLFGGLCPGPARAQEKQPLNFKLLLPAGSVVYIDGFKYQVFDCRNRFRSSPVTVGREYEYTVKAMFNGKEVVRALTLRHDRENVFDLNDGFKAAVKPVAFEAKGAPAKTAHKSGPTRPGFVTFEEDGRLWVFRAGSKDLAAFEKDGELAKHVTRIHAGPRGRTIKAPDNETIVDFMTRRDGFEMIVEDGRLWVFRAGSKDLAAFKKDGELAKHVTRIHAGPLGMTLKAPDAETLDAYLKAVAE